MIYFEFNWLHLSSCFNAIPSATNASETVLEDLLDYRSTSCIQPLLLMGDYYVHNISSILFPALIRLPSHGKIKYDFSKNP